MTFLHLRVPSRRRILRQALWVWLVVAVFLGLGWPPLALAAEALVLGQGVPIRRTPQASGKVIQAARPGETYEVPGRRPGPGKSQPLYVLDEHGDVWVKVRVSDEETGFLPMDFVSVAREEYRPPRSGGPLLIVNLRPTGDGGVTRDLWLIQDGWQTQRLATIEGRPIWASHGGWFIAQVDSGKPIKDQSVDRNIERIEKFSADGRTRTVLAVGSYPVLNEPRGEVYFYRDVDEQGAAVSPGLFAVNLEGGGLRAVHLLPERYKFWKEDGDFFVQAPPPVLQTAPNRILFFAFEPAGSRVRFAVSPEGQFLELRRD